jgi:hypothetical protein
MSAAPAGVAVSTRIAAATDKTNTARKDMLPLIALSLFLVIQIRMCGNTDFGIMPP